MGIRLIREFIQENICHKVEVQDTLNRFEEVFHIAFIGGGPESFVRH